MPCSFSILFLATAENKMMYPVLLKTQMSRTGKDLKKQSVSQQREAAEFEKAYFCRVCLPARSITSLLFTSNKVLPTFAIDARKGF